MPEILLEIAGEKEDDALLVMIITIAENTVPQEEDDRREANASSLVSKLELSNHMSLSLGLRAVGRQI
jgi:hypothetical protein